MSYGHLLRKSLSVPVPSSVTLLCLHCNSCLWLHRLTLLSFSSLLHNESHFHDCPGFLYLPFSYPFGAWGPLHHEPSNCSWHRTAAIFCFDWAVWRRSVHYPVPAPSAQTLHALSYHSSPTTKHAQVPLMVSGSLIVLLHVFILLQSRALDQVWYFCCGCCCFICKLRK